MRARFVPAHPIARKPRTGPTRVSLLSELIGAPLDGCLRCRSGRASTKDPCAPRRAQSRKRRRCRPSGCSLRLARCAERCRRLSIGQQPRPTAMFRRPCKARMWCTQTRRRQMRGWTWRIPYACRTRAELTRRPYQSALACRRTASAGTASRQCGGHARHPVRSAQSQTLGNHPQTLSSVAN